MDSGSPEEQALTRILLVTACITSRKKEDKNYLIRSLYRILCLKFSLSLHFFSVMIKKVFLYRILCMKFSPSPLSLAAKAWTQVDTSSQGGDSYRIKAKEQEELQSRCLWRWHWGPGNSNAHGSKWTNQAYGMTVATFLHFWVFLACMWAEWLQSCATLCDPMDCSLPGSPVHRDSPGKNTGVGCHALLQRNLHNRGTEPISLLSLALGALPQVPPGKPLQCFLSYYYLFCKPDSPAFPMSPTTGLKC